MDKGYKLFEYREIKLITRAGSTDFAIARHACRQDYYLRNPRLEIFEYDTVVDIGAHIGAFTIMAAKRGAEVYAYEPDPDNYKLLEINIALNRVEYQVRAYNYAMSDFNGPAKLYRNLDNAGAHTLYPGEEPWPAIDINVLEFNHEAEKRLTIDFLKLDCEFAEWPILLNSNLFKVDQISMEYHLNKNKIESLRTKLKADDFEILEITEISKDRGLLQARRNKPWKIT